MFFFILLTFFYFIEFLLFVNLGHDVTSADHLKEAMDSYGGVKGCQAAIVELDVELQSTVKPFELKGISKLKQFEYTSDSGMTVWQAWNIGRGKKICTPSDTQDETGITVTQPFLEPKVISGVLKKPAKEPCQAVAKQTNNAVAQDKEPGARTKFYCPEEGCIKAYRCSRYLQQHLDVGKHEFKLHKESQYDQIRRKWAQRCTSLQPPNPSCPCESKPDVDRAPEVLSGWALRKARAANRFSVQVKTYLMEQFMIGENTGRKVTPQEASTRMRSMRDSSGEKVFTKEDWLTVQQITSYFSRLAAMKKLGELPPTALTEEEEEEVEVAIHATTRYNFRERVMRKLTL